MIKSYLGYIDIIEMVSRRLTKTQKAEILEAYRSGDNTNALAEKYHCTPNTINRTVKTLLSESCLLYTSPSPRDVEESRMPSSA